MTWGQLFEMVWADSTAEERAALLDPGCRWLAEKFTDGAWNYVWQLLWAHEPGRKVLRDLGLQWVLENPEHMGWGFVWQGLLLKGGFDDPDLAEAGLAGIIHGPESPAEIPIWEHVEMLVPRSRFLDAIVRKMARMHYLKTAVSFFVARAGEQSPVAAARQAFEQTMAEPRWVWLWYELLESGASDLELLDLGRQWLDGREDRTEWTHVWRRLIDADYECDDLLLVGQQWLDGRDDRPDWAYVWRWLIDADYQRRDLLHLGWQWLNEREDRPEWAYIWERLMDAGYEHEDLLPIGRQWLGGREDRPDWAYIWEYLLDANYEREDLLPLGRQWLGGREDRQEWPFVWEYLMRYTSSPGPNLIAAAGSWLTEHADHPIASRVAWRLSNSSSTNTR